MLRIGSLFSGYGGLDLATQSVLGGEIAWHVEYDDAPSRILKHHYPDVPNYGDVTTVDWASVEPVDVLTGGYPCQPFSQAGKRKGTKDERHLWPEVLRAIREMGPRLVVLENVRGHLTLGFNVVLADLAGMGWSARWGVVRASDAGCCHQRARLFIVAYPDGNVIANAYGIADGQRGESSRVDRQKPTIKSGRINGSDIHARTGCSILNNKTSINFGPFADAVAKWESIIGRPAPAPTESGHTGKPRLTPRFVEWMMGLPKGWVTDRAIGISHSAQLKVLGNGVVPQQAALALRLLLA